MASDPIGLLPIAGEGAGRSRQGNLSPGSRRGLAAWSHVRRADRIFSIFLPDTKSGFRTFLKRISRSIEINHNISSK